MTYLFKPIFLILCVFFNCILRANEPDCEVIEYNVEYNVLTNKLIEETSYLLQINNRMGDKYGSISLPYSKRNKIISLKAWLEDNQGNIIRELKKNEITDQSAISDISLYEDDFVKKFTLRHNFYPYRIGYTVKYAYSEFMEIADWYPAIDNDVPTRKARLEIHTPLYYPIKYWMHEVKEPSIDTVNSEIIYTFSVSEINLPKKEKYCPPLQRLLPFVRVVPENFKWVYEGSHINWLEYGNWLNKITSGLDQLPENEKQSVRNLIKDKTDKHEVIKILYHFLQDRCRYINVSIDVGGLKPYPAEYVSKNKYGDCKALSVYMKALLNEAGITSHYATIYAGEDFPVFIPEFPSHQANHMLLFVPLETDTVFLECTSNNCSVGYMGIFTQGRDALVVEENNSKIIHTPELKPYEALETRKIGFTISVENCTMSFLNSYKGAKFDYFNSMSTYLNKKETEDYIRENILMFPGFELANWNISKPDRDSASIYFNASLKLTNYLRSYGLNLGIPLISINLPILEKPTVRKLPVYLEYPIYKIDTIQISISESFNIKSIPENSSIKSKFGDYTIVYKAEANSIHIYRKFILYRGEYPVSEYQTFYSFFNDIINAERKLIMITKI